MMAAIRRGMAAHLRVRSMLRPYRLGFRRVVLLASIPMALNLISPLLTRLLIDSVYPSRDLESIGPLVLCILLVGALSAWAAYLRGIASVIVTSHAGTALTHALFERMLTLPMRYFETQRHGDLMIRLGEARSMVASTLGALETVCIYGLFVVAVPPILFLMHWKLALLTVVTAPVTALVTIAFSRASQARWRESNAAAGTLSSFVSERLYQMRTIKSFALEDWQLAGLRGAMSASRTAELRATVLAMTMSLVSSLITVAAGALFSWFAWRLVLRGEISLGSFVAFSSYALMFATPLDRLGNVFANLPQVGVNADRVFEILALPSERADLPEGGALPLDIRRDRRDIAAELICARDLGFSYGASPSLRSVDVCLQAGEFVVVVGESGSGKSTLLKVIAGVETEFTGSLSVLGQPAQLLAPRAHRRVVSSVWQEFQPFRGTLRENLLLGMSRTDAQIHEALSIAQCSDIVTLSPDGLDMEILEVGAGMSGGQRQRLAVARAILRGCPILLLDEATANSDPAREAAIIDAVRAFPCGIRGVMLVTHRLSIAEQADRVVFMDGGRIVAEGSHLSLLDSIPAYRAFATGMRAIESEVHATA